MFDLQESRKWRVESSSTTSIFYFLLTIFSCISTLMRCRMALIPMARHGELYEDKGQHREHERLDNRHKYFKTVKRQGHEIWYEHKYYSKEYLSGKYVAEQPERKRNDFREFG